MFIKRWDSVFKASKELKIINSAIYECVKNKRKSAGGFIWKRV